MGRARPCAKVHVQVPEGDQREEVGQERCERLPLEVPRPGQPLQFALSLPSVALARKAEIYYLEDHGT